MSDLTICNQTFPIILDEVGEEHVTLVHLCQPFGLKVQSQRERLEKTGWATLPMIGGVRTSGKRTKFHCLSLDHVPMFFATLDPGRVNPEHREPLVAMQREAARAVGDYYRRGGAIRPTALPQQLVELQRFIDEVLREKPLLIPMWPDRFVRRYATWHGVTWKAGESQPRSMASANDFIYRMIFPGDVYAIVKARGIEEACRYHQTLADVPRDYMQRQWDVICALADESITETEWRTRMRRAYRKTKSDLAGQPGLFLPGQA